MTVSLRALFITLLLAAVAWTTREITSFGFLPLVDDDVNIFYNPHLGAPDPSRLHWMATDFSYVHRYMPLGWLGFSLVYAVTGLDPWGYHAAGVLLHAVNAILVFLVLDQVLRRFEGGSPDRDRVICAGLAALLWALHPLRVETTAWCSGLLYSQAGCLALLCVLARFSELRALSRGRRGRAAICLGLGWLAYLASMLTYPVALFLPFALAVVDHAWLAAGAEDATRARRAARMGAMLYGMTAVAGVALTIYARGTALASWLKAATIAEFGPLARGLQAAYVAAVYLWRTVWTGDVRGMPLTLFDAGATGRLGWVAGALLVAITGWAWHLRKRAPYVGVCWACYLILVIPNLGLSEHPHTIADRYLYFTGVVFSAALALAMVRLRSRSALAGTEIACALAAVACAWVSVGQARIWRSTNSFEAHMMENPDLDLDHITAARAGKLRFLEGDVRGGRNAVWQELGRAPAVGGVILTWSQIAPGAPLSAQVASTRLQEWPAAPFAVANMQIARDQVAEGRLRDALLHLDAALEIAPDYAQARFRRGVILAASGYSGPALHDWLSVAYAGELRSSATREQFDFMTDCLRKEYSAEGNGRAAEFVRSGGVRADERVKNEARSY
jgi:hypothetical protein